MKNFLIEKGKHYSNHFLRLYLFKREIKFKFKFDSNCKYFFGNENDSDINKLFGISLGYHMKNSIRLGWRWNIYKKQFEILPYAHINGVRMPEYEGKIYNVLSTINSNELAECTIKINKYSYDIEIKTCTSIDFVSIPKPYLPRIGYYLWPYFGGNEVTPHNMNIYIEY